MTSASARCAARRCIDRVAYRYTAERTRGWRKVTALAQLKESRELGALRASTSTPSRDAARRIECRLAHRLDRGDQQQLTQLGGQRREPALEALLDPVRQPLGVR